MGFQALTHYEVLGAEKAKTVAPNIARHQEGVNHDGLQLFVQKF